jgi:pimeloyl-ACP methyl ester carboxylesterase
MRAEPFSIDVDDAVLDDLRERLARTRWPSAAPGDPWSQGTDLDYLQRLGAYWADGFDWRAQQRDLNRWPQFIADVDGVRIHFVHVRGGGIPLILTHGWPSAFVEFLPLIERLQHSFDLVIPSLPGYAFSERPPTLTTRDTAKLWHTLMQGLGYERYGAHGGDFGAAVSTYMALDEPESLLGIHLSNLDNAPTVTTPLTAAERAFVAATEHWDATQRGYSFIQGTKPQTLAYGLADSPAGLAAWILEKWRSWADTGGDLESRFDRDFLLTLVTLYWVTQTFGTSIRDYIDNRAAGTATLGPDDFVSVPTAIANFHCNFVSEGVLPREWAERMYDVRSFRNMRRGGHFAAAEEPDLLAAHLTAFFARGMDADAR